MHDFCASHVSGVPTSPRPALPVWSIAYRGMGRFSADRSVKPGRIFVENTSRREKHFGGASLACGSYKAFCRLDCVVRLCERANRLGLSCGLHLMRVPSCLVVSTCFLLVEAYACAVCFFAAPALMPSSKSILVSAVSTTFRTGLPLSTLRSCVTCAVRQLCRVTAS